MQRVNVVETRIGDLQSLTIENSLTLLHFFSSNKYGWKKGIFDLVIYNQSKPMVSMITMDEFSKWQTIIFYSTAL